MSRRTSKKWMGIAALLPGAAAVGQGAPGVWLRQFPPPAPINVLAAPLGESFFAWSPELGLLRFPVDGLLHHPATSCLVEAAVTPAEGGFDIAYQVSNPTSAAVDAPTLVIDGLPLAGEAEFLNHASGCSFTALQPQDNGSICSSSLKYPDALYAPVMVLRDSRFAVSLSLKYPVLDYRQSVTTFAARWPGAVNWTAYFDLQGTIAPGQSRSYSLSVRYAFPGDWIHTVRAYRDYFWSLYGSEPRYLQDRRPVFGASASSESFFADDNDRGFHPVLRPDLAGWKESVDWLLANVVERGYQRIMMWTPSGHYRYNFGNNFAPQFMSEWTGPMEQTAGEFERIRSRGVQMCFWWGHSGRVADSWDDDWLELFDPSNPLHQEAMLREWTLAVERGADGAGLDAFEELPLWTALSWMGTLRVHKNDAFLIAEGACADVMHMLVPFWIEGSNLPFPHLLADYLVPGREIWANLTGSDVTVERVQEVESWGMTVCIIGVVMLEPGTGEVVIPTPGGP